MFSGMFSGGRFSSYYGRRDSSSDEEEVSSGFRLQQGAGAGAGAAAASSAGSSALAAALDGRLDTSAGRITLENESDGMDVDAAVAAAAQHLCVECADQPASLRCVDCANDIYCDVCFAAMHKRGSRATHKHEPYAAGEQMAKALNAQAGAQPSTQQASDMQEDEEAADGAPSSSSAAAAAAASPAEVSDDMLEAAFMAKKHGSTSASASESAAAAAPAPRPGRASHSDSDEEEQDEDQEDEDDGASSSRGIILPSSAMNASLVSGGSVSRLLSNGLPADWFLNRARYIPLRLTLEERKFLRLLEATLNVSEYTDKVDIISSKDKMTRIKEQLRDLCSILSGLVVANDYKLGQKLLKDKEFADNEAFFQNVFELGRRHKIRNPEKMRSVYGKMVYVIQDSVNPAISDLMGFDLYGPLKTVYRELESAGALAVLSDERMMLATGDIKTEGRGRPEIERDIARKNAAVTFLARTYANERIDETGMRACILSIADNHTYLLQNRHSCDTMLTWLTECFGAHEPANSAHSLAILGGRNGARLTHSHSAQYAYVMQSLMLWREIIHDFFRLWVHTEEDLFDRQNPYRLRNTGQGLNRVQQAPRVGKAMHNILHHCQSKLGHWVGSSVIHLGDHNVPNALSFIDKYTQVSRILNPIVLTIKAIPRLCERKDVNFYIQTVFGGPDALKMLVLTDFFRSAFDGSGAENFFDAGSCIDGRLTSAWNWCNKLEKKSYYTVFQLSGFSSFDGQWSD